MAADLGRTLVVEAAVHHLDCLLELPDRPSPAQEAIRVTAATMSALAGVDLPATQEWVLKGTGRLPLTEGDRLLLGQAAERFPVLT